MVRSGILGGLGHSDSRVEFGSSVFGHLERGMAKSGKRGHRTGWGHSNHSHIRFRHSNSVSSKIGHGTGLGSSNRSGDLRLCWREVKQNWGAGQRRNNTGSYERKNSITSHI